MKEYELHIWSLYFDYTTNKAKENHKTYAEAKAYIERYFRGDAISFWIGYNLLRDKFNR